MKNKKPILDYNDNNLILMFVITTIIVAVAANFLVGSLLPVFINYNIKDKYQTEAEEESVIPEGTVAYINVLGYKKEYYLNEPFDFNNDIIIRAGYYKNGDVVDVQFDSSTEFTPIVFLEGEVPTTNTLGNHTFIINYGGSRSYCYYSVVEFNPYHFLNFVSNTITGGNKTMIDIQNYGTTSICKNSETKAFVSGIANSIYYNKTTDSFNSMYYLGQVASLLENAISSGSSSYSTYDITPNGETTPSICELNGNTYAGAMWTSYYKQSGKTNEYFNFELVASNNNKGFKLTIETNGKTTCILGTFNEKKYNLCIQGEEDYDILLNYSKNIYSYAIQTKGLNNNLNNLSYNENFANSGLQSLVYNLTTNTHTFN